MRLISFRARSLNHRKALALTFNRQLTFLTGVNGSGKTSVLASIIALLTPNLDALASISFEEIEVEFELAGKRRSVSAAKSNDIVTLKLKGSRDTFQFRIFEEGFFGPEVAETRSRYYADLLNGSLANPVLRELAEIPTPMFLGLDRRYRGSISPRARLQTRQIARRRKRNVFGSPLGDSLLQAVALAEDKYALSRSRTSQLDKQFLKDLLLTLITVPHQRHYGEILRPSGEDRKLLDQARKAITKFPRIEGISADDVRSRMEPIIKGIAEVLQIIPSDFDFSDFQVKTKKEREIFDALVRWSGYKPTLDQLKAVANLITGYNDSVTQNTREINSYLRLIDEFLSHTNKSAGFNVHGALEIRSETGSFGVEDLSSGEAQVIVILTHLAFNEDVENAGVFVVDEPELSLHIIWQEMLVESMMKANADVQYILATHSPSIIMDRVDCALDLNRQSER